MKINFEGNFLIYLYRYVQYFEFNFYFQAAHIQTLSLILDFMSKNTVIQFDYLTLT